MSLFKKKKEIPFSFATVIAVAKEKVEKINVLGKTLLVENDSEWKKTSAELVWKSTQCLQEGINLLAITFPGRKKDKSMVLHIKMLEVLQELDSILFDCVLYNGLIERKLYPLAQRFLDLVEENCRI